MREIIEDAAVIYKHEAEYLLIIAAPAIVVGPLCVLVAASGLGAALATVPVFMLVYLFTYAACLRAAKLVLDSEAPDPSLACIGALARLPAIAVASAPIAALMAVTVASALLISDQGFPLVAFGAGLCGALGALYWTARHIYDLPLVVGYGAGGLQALRNGANVVEAAPQFTARVVTATAVPLVFAWLICWGFWSLLAPAFGGAVFAAIVAFWLPFAALSFTNACSQLVGQQQAADAPAV